MSLRELPVIFNDDMVRAILDGRKSITRRPVIRQPVASWWEPYRCPDGRWNWVVKETGMGSGDPFRSPFGVVGDLLWVREAFCYQTDDDGRVRYDGSFWYRATDAHLGITKIDEDGGIAFRKDGSEASPWIPSIHMPREASRITLEVLNVWIERLQSLTEKSASAEGFHREGCGGEGNTRTFARSWDAIYAAKGFGWDENPWTWCCEFRVVRS